MTFCWELYLFCVSTIMASVVAQSVDWQLKKSVLETNRYMFENQFFCDVKFNIGRKDGNTISAHKYMLVSRSPVFCAMFTGPAKDDSSVVIVEDSDVDSFRQLLRFIYFEEATLNGENVLSVLYLAKKYMVIDLEDMCTEYLQNELDKSNVCMILEQASVFSERELEERCFDLLDDAATEALQSDGFTEINQETVLKIVRRDSLCVEELDVYTSCLRWAEAECRRQDREINDENKRLVLGDILGQIRFPLMDSDTFVKSVLISKVLKSEESVDILLAMRGETPNQQSRKFSMKERGPSRWTQEIYENVEIDGDYPGITKSVVHIKLKSHCRKVSVKSIYYVFWGEGDVEAVHLNSFKAMIARSDRTTTSGFGIYEADFESPVILNAGETAILEFQLSGDYYICRVNGTSVNNEHLEFEASPDENLEKGYWYHFIGLKYKAFR